MTEIKKRGLGRGLDALFSDARKEEASFQRKEAAAPVPAAAPAAARPAAPVQKVYVPEDAPAPRRADEMLAAASAATDVKAQTSGAPRKMRVDRLQPGQYQPRRHFSDEAISNLAESIGVHGVLQPLFVRPLSNGMHEIIAGERRWRAAQKARIHEVPVIVLDVSDNDALEIGLIENLQREDLSPLEEAEGYQRLMDEFRHTQDVLAHRLGKSRSHVTNTLRLLKLPRPVQNFLREGLLTAGHARALVGSPYAERIAATVVKRGLSVRQTEKIVKQLEGGKAKPNNKIAPKAYVPRDVDIMALEEKLAGLLGLKVSIDGQGAEGKLTVEYKNLDQLDDLIARLSRPPVKY